MIGRKQRQTFFAVGAASFFVGALLLWLGFGVDQFALKVMGPCFMLTGVTWTIMVVLTLRFTRIPQTAAPVPAASEPVPRASGGGRVRLPDSGFVDPSQCFCDLSVEEMRPWVQKRTIDHISTMELLKSTANPREKEVISIIAMLDVDEDTLLGVMVGVDKPDDHIIRCRQNARRMLGLD